MVISFIHFTLADPINHTAILTYSSLGIQNDMMSLLLALSLSLNVSMATLTCRVDYLDYITGIGNDVMCTSLAGSLHVSSVGVQCFIWLNVAPLCLMSISHIYCVSMNERDMLKWL